MKPWWNKLIMVLSFIHRNSHAGVFCFVMATLAPVEKCVDATVSKMDECHLEVSARGNDALPMQNKMHYIFYRNEFRSHKNLIRTVGTVLDGYFTLC